MALSMTACGGDKEPEKENTAKTEATEKEPEVEVTYQSILDDYQKRLLMRLRDLWKNIITKQLRLPET